MSRRSMELLRYQADLRPLAFNFAYFALLFAAFVFVPIEQWVLSVPLFLALCVTAFLGAVQTHNSVHGPIFHSRILNKVYQCVLTLIYGHPVSSYVPGHNLSHHKHTQSRKDVMRTTKARFRYNLFNGIFFFVLVAPSIMRADSMYTKVMWTRNPVWFRQMLVEIVVLWSVQIALFVIDWQKALAFWLVPHFYAQWGIVTMNLLQHDGTDGESRYNHSRNFVGKWINWWTFNNGFHTIHHDYPGLHWSLAPERHAEEIAPHITPSLDQPSLIAYVWRTFFLNQRVDYLGNPVVLPDEGPDEDWIPDPRLTLNDLGAGGLSA
ncbi:MAG: fatty acid desaturase [Polyangiales bacterium]